MGIDVSRHTGSRRPVIISGLNTGFIVIVITTEIEDLKEDFQKNFVFYKLDMSIVLDVIHKFLKGADGTVA
ncbi:hypothetical protein DSUL_20315 [Desulfovibrionales bacterium]